MKHWISVISKTFHVLKFPRAMAGVVSIGLSLGVDRLSAPILSILPIIDIGHFQNRFADIFFIFL